MRFATGLRRLQMLCVAARVAVAVDLAGVFLASCAGTATASRGADAGA